MDALPGSFLRALRLRLGLSLRDVQRMSLRITTGERDRRFYISATRLDEIENSVKTPSQFKIFTLAAIYGVSFHELLGKYGVDPDRTHRYRAQIKLPTTHPVSSEVHNLERKIVFPIRFDPSFRWERTQLINRAVALWGEIPAAFLADCNPKEHMYAYVGLEDDTMGPLLRPGSLVMIDQQLRRVRNHGWTSEYDRPIYLIELRDGYLCGWCYLFHSSLTIIPHPNSAAPPRTFSLSNEAEIVGQVVAVAMRLVPLAPPNEEPDIVSPTRF
jgi:transcriptional regulator with XRE-family HTH domain